MRHFCLVLWLVATAANVWAQGSIRTTVDAIVSNPGCCIDNAVEVEGLVTQYVPATSSTTSYYLLKGDYGAIIRVNTAENAPETNRKYRVSGIVYPDPVTREPFISEKSKIGPLKSTQELAEEEQQAKMMEEERAKTQRDRILLILFVTFLLVILTIILIYLLVKRKRDGVSSKQMVSYSTGPSISSASDGDFKTVKIASSKVPPTIKIFPGELVIISGEDKGKSFKIAGFPTPEGSIVTVGREPVNGERAFAHIQLDNRFQTVSRRQAEIIGRDGRLYVRNVSETNPTQVDGIELKLGEKAELRPGSIIKTGELEFQYKI